MDIFLHIGWHKTGTTAIQSLLLRNQKALQRHLDCCYPSAGLYNLAHNLPAWALQLPLRAKLLEEIGCAADSESLFRDMLAEAARARSRSMIISSEEFSPIYRYSLDRLVKAFAGHRVVVIAYIRRQDEYIESVYNQMVRFWRSRFTGDFDAFVERHLRSGRLNYASYFRQWAAAFGRDNLRVRVYDRRRFRDRDVRRDFCDLAGIPDGRIEWESGNVNESLDSDSVHFLSRFNRVPLTEAQHQAVVRAVREYSRGRPDATYGLLDARQRQRIVSHFERSNDEFAREFLNGAPGFNAVDTTAADPSPFDEPRFLEMLGFVLPRLVRAGKTKSAPPEARRRRTA